MLPHVHITVVTPVHGLPVFHLHYVMEGSSDLAIFEQDEPFALFYVELSIPTGQTLFK